MVDFTNGDRIAGLVGLVVVAADCRGGGAG